MKTVFALVCLSSRCVSTNLFEDLKTSSDILTDVVCINLFQLYMAGNSKGETGKILGTGDSRIGRSLGRA